MDSYGDRHDDSAPWQGGGGGVGWVINFSAGPRCNWWR